MARLKLKQVLSNLHYDAGNDQLILCGSAPPANQNWEDANQTWDQTSGDWDGTRAGTPDFVIFGSTVVTSSAYSTASFTITGLDTFGDSGSFFTMDLGDY